MLATLFHPPSPAIRKLQISSHPLPTWPQHGAPPGVLKTSPVYRLQVSRFIPSRATVSQLAQFHCVFPLIPHPGNCLFRALSDQLYGHQNKHLEVRDKIINHIRANKAYFINFMAANDNRRSGRRHASSLVTGPVAQETLDARFEARVKVMEKSGTWGDNVEVSASAAAFGVRVHLWTEQYQVFFPEEETGCTTTPMPKIQIAFHVSLTLFGKFRIWFRHHTNSSQSWGHYSSVHKIGAEHKGILDPTPPTRLTLRLKLRPSGAPSTSKPITQPLSNSIPIRSLPATTPNPESSPSQSPKPTPKGRLRRSRPAVRPLTRDSSTTRRIRLRRLKTELENRISSSPPSPSSYSSSSEFLSALEIYKQRRTLVLRQREESLGLNSPIESASPASSGDGWETGTSGSSLSIGQSFQN